MKKRIYLADDDRNIRELMSTFLINAGFEAEAFPSGDALLNAFEKSRPDLVILDIMMPGTDGLTVCSRLRQKDASLPIIIVSARDDPYDRVTGLSLGSDDYLVKPFLPLELVARVNALFRRTDTASGAKKDGPLSFGSLTLREDAREAFIGTSPLSLTPAEFGFLTYLLKNKERAVSRNELLRELWSFDFEADTRVSDDLLKRLRKKLREKGADFEIETVWGFGFRLVKKEEKP
ncbi:MAG: response regulator transcription factor [Clostridia bacterium]|nr:response regulator transcription factor [Clostridia bacterium]